MALMPGLQINIGQQLKLTPQLQQSIKILQYSALEVQQTISTTLETNFMLELDEDRPEDAEEFASEEEAAEVSDASENEIDIEASDTLSDDLQIDCEWEEVYTDISPVSSSIKSDNDDYTSPENYTSSEVTLSEKLYWQSDIYSWTETQELIASYIIDDINDEGYLKTPLENILADIQEKEPDLLIHLSDIEGVLSVIQQFEPTGVGARDLSECLILQLKALHQNPYVVTAIKIIEENFDLLSVRDYKRIKKIYLLNDDELTEVIQVIQSLSPRPGREYSSTQGEIVIPDLKLYRTKDGFMVELNQDAFPRLTINSAYINMAGDLGSSSQEAKQIKEQLTEAKGLIKSIQSRGETLLRVGKYIVEKQARFFDEGEQAMQPMVLRDVAESLELHESTISRATNQKYMQTPRGTFELKYFFSTGVSQYGSEDQSAIAIKSHIKQLIDDEDPNKPLSDNKLMALLEEKEINVARRTIAKYREAMHIPSSSERKKLNKFK
ncbi:RNA polymerase factor sigma-54 [Hydrogenovibrio thermophilus]|uniref:RNA polymerase sigma-54 factor n=1 Tax=Hydrogenovibrio thermophilus TaxID=265883 RepID=A0A410H366_9GAMM|nr:RNA polymerase factor sigma-54 [Hydrogenovibrio thermophilus]QAB15363.1 RNA polymerase factor sigma-54 [Hydrogenovibrio thermophilus]